VVAADAADRARQVRFLAGRGFSGAVIRKVVGGADDE
jgi:regulatory protein